MFVAVEFPAIALMPNLANMPAGSSSSPLISSISHSHISLIKFGSGLAHSGAGSGNACAIVYGVHSASLKHAASAGTRSPSGPSYLPRSTPSSPSSSAPLAHAGSVQSFLQVAPSGVPGGKSEPSHCSPKPGSRMPLPQWQVFLHSLVLRTAHLPFPSPGQSASVSHVSVGYPS